MTARPDEPHAYIPDSTQCHDTAVLNHNSAMLHSSPHGNAHSPSAKTRTHTRTIHTHRGRTAILTPLTPCLRALVLTTLQQVHTMTRSMQQGIHSNDRSGNDDGDSESDGDDNDEQEDDDVITEM